MQVWGREAWLLGTEHGTGLHRGRPQTWLSDLLAEGACRRSSQMIFKAKF